MSSSVIPCLRYSDARAAIAVLRNAFGFAEHLVVPGPDERIEHAEVTFRDGMVMLGSTRDDGMGWRSVEESGGFTQTIYFVLDDVDGHCARARESGATIVMEPADQDHGGRMYGARDPGGHVWYLGSYRP